MSCKLIDLEHPAPPFDTVEAAVADIAAGRIVIVTDDEARENEGDFVMAASKVTPEAVNLMLQHGRGLLCTPTVAHQLKRLWYQLTMVADNRENQQTDFSISVDASEGITTGISAFDRAATIKILADPYATPDMLVRPGHVFPLRSRPGGVLQRAGHTEAAVDLASLAGLHPSGVICEILKEDGTLARLPELVEYKKRFGLKLISIAQLIYYRHRREKLVQRVIAYCRSDSEFGHFDLHIYRTPPGRADAHTLTLARRPRRDSHAGARAKRKPAGGCLPLAPDWRFPFAGQVPGAHCPRKPRRTCLYRTVGRRVESRAATARRARPVHAGTPSRMDFRDAGVGAQILADLGLKHNPPA